MTKLSDALISVRGPSRKPQIEHINTPRFVALSREPLTPSGYGKKSKAEGNHRTRLGPSLHVNTTKQQRSCAKLWRD